MLRPQAVTDARAVCHKLGIPYYLIDEAAEFQNKVIQYFADEYKAGRTPNPCVMCNQNLKFGRLMTGRPARRALFWLRATLRGWSAARMAPARCSSGGAICGRARAFPFLAAAGATGAGDVSLGGEDKSDARAVAHDCKLKTADKEESISPSP